MTRHTLSLALLRRGVGNLQMFSYMSDAANDIAQVFHVTPRVVSSFLFDASTHHQHHLPVKASAREAIVMLRGMMKMTRVKPPTKCARALVQHTTRCQRRQATSDGLVKLHMKVLQQGNASPEISSQTLIIFRKVSASMFASKVDEPDQVAFKTIVAQRACYPPQQPTTPLCASTCASLRGLSQKLQKLDCKSHLLNLG
jgi:hypothetical protein